MFSSSNNAYPFPQLTSSIHVSSPSFFGHDIFLHHHRDLVVDHMLPAIENVSTNVATTRPNGDHPLELLPRKKLANRDRHRKILTAQGPRDRRVRLSIQIAHKFFDLQEMLGFDKASRTLDWLLTKSKTAIQELEQMRLSCSAKSFSSTNSECEEAQGIRVSKRKPLTSVTKEKRILRQPHKSAFLLLAKESRANARARARERTREKMCIRKLGELKKPPVSVLSPIVNQSSCWNQVETCAKLGSYNRIVDAEISTLPISHLPLVNEAQRKEIIGESNIVIKRKSKPSQIFDYQQNLIISKEVSSYSNNYSTDITENWEISSTITPTVPPTELQNRGKLWEEVCNNRISQA